MTTPARRHSAAFSAALAFGAALAPVACEPAAPPRAAMAANDSWCPDGFEVGPQDTCFAVPETHAKDTPVLVYLHGMYKGHGSAEEWALVRTATTQGFAVVVPRGKRGMCAWKAELADAFCWPHEPEDPQSFRAVVAEWDRVLWQIDALLEGGVHERFVLGVSNGGFFAEHLATEGYVAARAYAVVHGGGLAPPSAVGRALAPQLLLSAEGDAEQGPKMKALHGELSRVGWPHAACVRPGSPDLAATDLDAALAFFRRHGAPAARGKSSSTSAASEWGCDAPFKPSTP
jgi:poly(3-hydroxybutyrate) depolymerase